MAESLSLKCLFQKITSKDMQRLETNQHFLSRPHRLGLYNISYTTFSTAKRVRFHFVEPHFSAYPLALGDTSDIYVALQYNTQKKHLDPLLLTNDKASPISVLDGNAAAVERTNVYTNRGTLEGIMSFCYAKFDFAVRVSRYEGKLYMFPPLLTEAEFENQQNCSHHRSLCQLVFRGKYDENWQIEVKRWFK